jgi:hypothetical protein
MTCESEDRESKLPLLGNKIGDVVVFLMVYHESSPASTVLSLGRSVGDWGWYVGIFTSVTCSFPPGKCSPLAASLEVEGEQAAPFASCGASSFTDDRSISLISRL